MLIKITFYFLSCEVFCVVKSSNTAIWDPSDCITYHFTSLDKSLYKHYFECNYLSIIFWLVVLS